MKITPLSVWQDLTESKFIGYRAMPFNCIRPGIRNVPLVLHKDGHDGKNNGCSLLCQFDFLHKDMQKVVKSSSSTFADVLGNIDLTDDEYMVKNVEVFKSSSSNSAGALGNNDSTDDELKVKKDEVPRRSENNRISLSSRKSAANKIFQQGGWHNVDALMPLSPIIDSPTNSLNGVIGTSM